MNLRIYIDNDYTTISDYKIAYKNDKAFELALNYANCYWSDRDNENFIVINIKGLKCIAYVLDAYNPIEIDNQVVEFGEHTGIKVSTIEPVLTFIN